MDLSLVLSATFYHISFAKSVELCETSKIFYINCIFLILYNIFRYLYSILILFRLICMIINDENLWIFMIKYSFFVKKIKKRYNISAISYNLYIIICIFLSKTY